MPSSVRRLLSVLAVSVRWLSALVVTVAFRIFLFLDKQSSLVFASRADRLLIRRAGFAGVTNTIPFFGEELYGLFALASSSVTLSRGRVCIWILSLLCDRTKVENQELEHYLQSNSVKGDSHNFTPFAAEIATKV
jgi:hypothetical protein